MSQKTGKKGKKLYSTSMLGATSTLKHLCILYEYITTQVSVIGVIWNTLFEVLITQLLPFFLPFLAVARVLC